MRASAVLMLATLAMLASVFVVAIRSLDTEQGKADETQSLFWANRTFSTKVEFAAWLEQRNASYADWVERHPGASPWEDDRGRPSAFALIAAALAAVLLLVVWARETIDDFVQDMLVRARALGRSEEAVRVSAQGDPGFSLLDAASAYSLIAPRVARRQPDAEHQDPDLVEAPQVESLAAFAPEREADIDTEPDASAADSPPRRALAVWAAARVESTSPRPTFKSAAPPTAPDAFESELDQLMSAGPDVPASLEEAPNSRSAEEAPTPDSLQEPIPPTLAPEAHDHEAREAAPTGEVVCEVDFWRGYVKAQFYARVSGDDRLSAIATSPMFRCRSATPEETEASRVALTALIDRLIAEGWEPNGRGRAWYARRFTNRIGS